jgi:hypothetical protein
MTKYTQDDYFAAASAHDLWTCIFNHNIPYSGINVVDACGAKLECYMDLMDKNEFYLQYLDEGMADYSFILVQLGCEKAGL